MKKVLLLTLLFALFTTLGFSQTDRFWSGNNESRSNIIKGKAVARLSFPSEFKLFNLNIELLRQEIFTVVGSPASRSSTVISLPNAKGQIEQFEIFEASNFEPALQAMYPQIRAFSGKGITDKSATLKLSISPQGIQTMVFRADKANEYIEPYSQDRTVYAVFNSQRNKGGLPWTCSTQDAQLASGLNSRVYNTANPLSSTGELKTMRLAQSCNGEYSNYFNAFSAADVALVLAAYNGTLTRCNGCYEKDLALHLNLIANTADVIYYNPATDPYTTLGAWNGQLQSTLNSVIGAANYDIGHMFGASGGGGNAGCIGCVCGTLKGSGITSPADGIPEGDNFDIDYVAHEVGHQLGGNHTFSMSNEGSGVNKEVGSGITIMGYAGITGQDVAPHSIDIFHEASIAQIQANLATKTCPVTTNISATNATPVIAPLTNYTIPISTPFALTGSATDANAQDTLTYCWEQDDNGTSATTGNASVANPTKTVGPNWLSFPPTLSPTRICPVLPTILAGLFTTGPLPGGDAIAKIEALSSVGRTLNFRLTVRDNSPYRSTAPVKVGQTSFADMAVTVTNTSGPFKVTSPNSPVSWAGGSTQTITWDVTNTTAAPVSCANVKISLSTDGGLTFPTVMSASTPNDGTEALTIPSIASTTARVKIEAVGNIFFDIDDADFTITAAATGFTFDSPAGASFACGGPTTATITLGTTAQGGFSTPINLSAAGNPVGTTVNFSVNPLAPGSSTIVTLNNTNTLVPGIYTITITGVAGTTTQTRELTYTVLPGTNPTITTQPSGVAVCSGASATFTVVVPGTVTYQWQVSTDGGVTYNNVAAGGNAASYTIPAVTSADNNNLYQVIVSTLCGSTTTSAATLTVNSAPAVTTQPADATVCVGSTNIFTVVGSGGGLTYQWQVSIDGGLTYTDMPGEINDSLVLTGITAAFNNNRYRVIITGSCPAPVTSTGAILIVGNAPSITSQPTDVTACAGDTATFTVTASGSGLSYQWQVSTDGGLTFTNISGQTNASLVLTGVTGAANNNIYTAIVTSSTCATPSNSDSATLIVNTLPAITTQPASVTLCAGGNATFTSVATGTGITYQWQISTDGGLTFTNITGATSASYAVNGVTAAQDGDQYHVIVSGTCAPAATSSAAILNVGSLVNITAQPASTSGCVGSDVTFTVTATTTGTINYQWQVSTDGGTTYTNIAGANAATLTVPAVDAAMNNNLYQVVLTTASCATATTSTPVTLTVNALPTVTASASSPGVCTGTTVTLTATGADSYTWSPVGLTGASINVTPVVNPATPDVPNTVTYTVTGTSNGCDNVSTVSVTANPLPVVTLTANPANVRLYPGRTVELTASVTPATGFVFTWEKNGVVIPGFTDNTLTATVEDIGSYTVTATDASGSCSSKSNLVTLADSATNTVFIYPNPNSGVFTISYYTVRRNSNQLNQQNVTVFDSRGARIYTKGFEVTPGGYQLLNINLRPISSGAYFVVLRDGYGNQIAAERIFVH